MSLTDLYADVAMVAGRLPGWLPRWYRLRVARRIVGALRVRHGVDLSGYVEDTDPGLIDLVAIGLKPESGTVTGTWAGPRRQRGGIEYPCPPPREERDL